MALTFYPFHLMVYLGGYFILFTLYGMYLLMRNKLFDNRLFLRLALWSIPLPFIVNELGWITAEVGRQPWIVYRVMKTADAISITVPATQILLSLILFVIIYALLFIFWVYLLKHVIRKGPEEQVEAAGKEVTA